MSLHSVSVPSSLSAIDWQVGDGWQSLVDQWRASPDGQRIQSLLAARLAAGAVIYPPDPLRGLRDAALDEVKVVIVGQDPYHGPGQAEGLAFSVPAGQKLPPSLRNIFKELLRDLGQQPAMSGHLGAWARRGVLLLNTSLTVEEGAAGSHAKQGWESLSDALIAATARHPAPKVYLLWGAHAQAKAAIIQAAGPAHLVLQANHPSPLSATRGPVPFIGCGHFSTAARWLQDRNVPFSWSLD